ncbi:MULTISPECIES: hypothetical protein [unclassified Rathayibacter]|uniref:hypothetical protein n=1 Tax=unclassified Rathayibacter TaxID=2609250 RepID=UPI00070138DF|nr:MULTISPECIES: hypothetical protein [unclassified Rathayibacter]KQQ03509.1 hypothetical protein ASF42_08335 [Rathayibacter sp. Leaf294]KQS11965.1 hypothetical protein ASG06_08335 [Rathayibacter sp. Leaf185]
MAYTALTTLFWIAVALGFLVRGSRRRGLRHAAQPAGAAASVLRDVYSGRGTEAAHSPEFDTAPTTSVELGGPDPLLAFGVGESAGRPDEKRRS